MVEDLSGRVDLDPLENTKLSAREGYFDGSENLCLTCSMCERCICAFAARSGRCFNT